MLKRLRPLPLILFLALAVFLPVTVSSDSHYVRFADGKALQKYMKWNPNRVPLISAHRGGPMGRFPENALETFENSLRFAPCLIECDVRLTRDGHLVLLHDDSLDRTTTGKGLVSDHTLAQLKRLFLKDGLNRVTGYRIPTFPETLEWAKGKAILSIDVKRNVPYEIVVKEVKRHKAEGHAIIIVNNTNDLKKVHRLAPDLMITGNARGIKAVERMFATGVPAGNLCAFVGVSEPEPAVYQALHKKGVRTVLGTMHNLDNKAAARGIKVYQKLYRNGADILATDNVALVSRAIDAMALIGQEKKEERRDK
ncbi:MAG: glycerophosphodiester phosphodiesterase family protein [bacterium]|nr:glycerophosphodiester phosphodiesterase family protein [bacterium]